MVKTKFAPFNDDIENNPDRDYIGGKYSTFDIGISKLATDVKNKKASHTKLYMQSRKLVDKKKAKEFFLNISKIFDTVAQEEHISKTLSNWQNIGNSEKIQIGQDIINQVVKIIDNNRLPAVKIEHRDDILNAEQIFEFIFMNLSNPIFSTYESFIEILKHEFIHIIDMRAPEISPLGAQIVDISNRRYKNNPKLHDMNPLEVNAFGHHWKFGKNK